MNYSVEYILASAEQDTCTPEMKDLQSMIRQYIEKTETEIHDAVSKLPEGSRTEVMTWITNHVEKSIQYYVRCAYLGKPYDILKKSNDKWKTTAELGLTIPQKKTEPKITVEEWMQILSDRACVIKQKGLHFYESHAHYDLIQFAQVRGELMKLLLDAGIERCVIPAITYEDVQKYISMFDAPEYDWVYYAIGSHPKYIRKEAEDWDEKRWEEFRSFLHHPKCRAVGEIGLDYSRFDFNEEERLFQEMMFVRFLEEANSANLPVILHIRPAQEGFGCTRDVHQDALRILKEHPLKTEAVVHCYGDGVDMMNAYLAVGVTCFGIGARITREMKNLEEAVKKMPAESILLETDSPYIRLETDRMPNTSLTLYEVAEAIARIRGEDVRTVAEISEKNFKRFFREK